MRSVGRRGRRGQAAAARGTVVSGGQSLLLHLLRDQLLLFAAFSGVLRAWFGLVCVPVCCFFGFCVLFRVLVISSREPKAKKKGEWFERVVASDFTPSSTHLNCRSRLPFRSSFPNFPSYGYCQAGCVYRIRFPDTIRPFIKRRAALPKPGRPYDEVPRREITDVATSVDESDIIELQSTRGSG